MNRPGFPRYLRAAAFGRLHPFVTGSNRPKAVDHLTQPLMFEAPLVPQLAEFFISGVLDLQRETASYIRCSSANRHHAFTI